MLNQKKRKRKKIGSPALYKTATQQFVIYYTQCRCWAYLHSIKVGDFEMMHKLLSFSTTAGTISQCIMAFTIIKAAIRAEKTVITKV